MRINKFVAQATGLSRRSADEAIKQGRVGINGSLPTLGQHVAPRDLVTLDDKPVTIDAYTITILLHKPVGYVCSRNGQGSKTVYDLLPKDFHHLKSVGRLDKDSSGLLVMTNDGAAAHTLTHPSYEKSKRYQVALDKQLTDKDRDHLLKGVLIDDGKSIFDTITNISGTLYEVSLHEGRNRQIRRTFQALGYRVQGLHRTVFGNYQLDDIPTGSYKKST